jgi:hypothetical protein
MACVCYHIAVQPNGGVHHPQSVPEQRKLVQVAETATWQLQPAGACHVTFRLWGLYTATLLLHKGGFPQGTQLSLFIRHAHCDWSRETSPTVLVRHTSVIVPWDTCHLIWPVTLFVCHIRYASYCVHTDTLQCLFRCSTNDTLVLLLQPPSSSSKDYLIGAGVGGVIVIFILFFVLVYVRRKYLPGIPNVKLIASVNPEYVNTGERHPSFLILSCYICKVILHFTVWTSTACCLKVAVLWGRMLCSLVDGHQRFKETCCLDIQSTILLVYLYKIVPQIARLIFSFKFWLKICMNWEHLGGLKVNTKVDRFGLFVNVVGQHSCSLKASCIFTSWLSIAEGRCCTMVLVVRVTFITVITKSYSLLLQCSCFWHVFLLRVVCLRLQLIFYRFLMFAMCATCLTNSSSANITVKWVARLLCSSKWRT